jgi:hypothetical protein
LTHFEQRDLMVHKSFELTSKNHTYAHRVEKIIEKTQNIDKKKTQNFNFDAVVKKHKKTFLLQIFKKVLLSIGTRIYGNEKGKRFARRAAYELSWRFFGSATYAAEGIVGRMFYEE